jgi:hypothetical protein
LGHYSSLALAFLPQSYAHAVFLTAPNKELNHIGHYYSIEKNQMMQNQSSEMEEQ